MWWGLGRFGRLGPSASDFRLLGLRRSSSVACGMLRFREVGVEGLGFRVEGGWG